MPNSRSRQPAQFDQPVRNSGHGTQSRGVSGFGMSRGRTFARARGGGGCPAHVFWGLDFEGAIMAYCAVGKGNLALEGETVHSEHLTLYRRVLERQVEPRKSRARAMQALVQKRPDTNMREGKRECLQFYMGGTRINSPSLYIYIYTCVCVCVCV